MPAAPLRDWEPAPRARLEAADRRVLNSINQALAAFRGNPLTTIGDLFAGRSMLLTYPELDVYPERGPSDYYGITKSAEGKLVPDWPVGDGPRVFVYLYHYYKGLASLADALARQRCSTLALCRGVNSDIKGRHHGGSVYFAEEPMSVSRVLPQADIVICHASHQMTAQALLAGKPLLLLPTQLEQFLITRRVVRYGAARDSRRKLVMTTASGRRHFVRALPAWEAAQSKVAQTIGTDAFAALVEQSKRVARTVARELGKGDGRG